MLLNCHPEPLLALPYHVQRHGLVGARDEDHDLPGVHHSAHADRQRLLRHLLDVVVEEPRVGVDCLLEEEIKRSSWARGMIGAVSDLVERLHPRPGDQGGAGLVEGDVAVGADAADEELHAARRLDLLLVLCALLLQVGGVAVQQVGVLGLRAFTNHNTMLCTLSLAELIFFMFSNNYAAGWW